MAKLLNLQLIYCEEKLAGDGKKDPLRRIKQWFSPGGTLLLEYDMATDKTTMTINLIEYLDKLNFKDD